MKPSSGGESSTDMVAEDVRYAGVGCVVVVVWWALVDYRRDGDVVLVLASGGLVMVRARRQRGKEV